MKRWPALVLGLALVILGYWLIGPLWHMTIHPPNSALPGGGTADWEQDITPAAVNRAILGILITLLSGPLMLWAWPRDGHSTRDRNWRGRVLVALRQIAGIMLSLLSTMIPLVFSLSIAGHILHWNHVQSQVAANRLFALLISGIAIYFFGGIAKVIMKRDKVDLGDPNARVNRRFETAWILLLCLGLGPPLVFAVILLVVPTLRMTNHQWAAFSHITHTLSPIASFWPLGIGMAMAGLQWVVARLRNPTRGDGPLGERQGDM
jgi:hypothetical protein